MSRIQIQERWEWEEQDYDTFLEELGEEQVRMMVLILLLIEKVFLLSPTLQPGIVLVLRNCFLQQVQYCLTFLKGFSLVQNQELHHILDLNSWHHLAFSYMHLLTLEFPSVLWVKCSQNSLRQYRDNEVLPLPCSDLDPGSSLLYPSEEDIGRDKSSGRKNKLVFAGFFLSFTSCTLYLV